jgi:hypothetical protein
MSLGQVDLLAESDVGGLGGDLPAVLALELRSSKEKRASKPRSSPFAIDMRRTGADRAKGGEGNGDTDLEVVGEAGVVAAAAGLQVGEAVQLCAHQKRVVHHLRRRLLARVEEGEGEWVNGRFGFASVRHAGGYREGIRRRTKQCLCAILDENDFARELWDLGGHFSH